MAASADLSVALRKERELMRSAVRDASVLVLAVTGRHYRAHVFNPVGKNMFNLYLVALGAVAVAVFAALAEGVHRVARPPSWEIATRHLRGDVSHAERRSRAMAFVGVDRRHQAQSVQVALNLAEARRAA